MRLEELVDVSERVRSAPSRREKVAHLADAFRGAAPETVRLAVAYLSGRIPQGRLGVGPTTVRDALADPAERSGLDLHDVDRGFSHIRDTRGAGSTAARAAILHDLFAAMTVPEQRFLMALLHGELRQGANEGVVADAVARAAGVSSASLRRAAMLAGSLTAAAEAAMNGGEPALAAFGLRLFQAVEPMLATPADSPLDAVGRFQDAVAEFKMDGARIQVHKGGDDVRVFSRRLRDVTASVPELVEAVARLPVREIVLDGETLALKPDGRPEPFQVTMRRFGRRLDVEALRGQLPLTPFFFDCLYLEGRSLVDLPGGERLAHLDEALPEDLRIPRVAVEDASAIEAFLARARAAGHEGVMVKDLTAVYAAGRRGRSWLKLKPAHSLDLVVLAAEWGHGRRKGWLSNLHLGARDPKSGGFVMLGKTFKGLTDQMLEWQTRALQEIEVARDRYTVYVEPSLVVEVAFNEIQVSPRYPAGLALRFARVRAYRPDKSAAEADTIDTVRALHASGP
jgi:DNA ligase-1